MQDESKRVQVTLSQTLSYKPILWKLKPIQNLWKVDVCFFRIFVFIQSFVSFYISGR